MDGAGASTGSSGGVRVSAGCLQVAGTSQCGERTSGIKTILDASCCIFHFCISTFNFLIGTVHGYKAF